MRHSWTNRRSERAFTLVEVLIISPLIVLLIGVVIAAIVSLTGNSLAVRQKAKMSGEMQTTIDTIEFDMNKAVNLPYQVPTAAMKTPQDLNNSGSSAITINTVPSGGSSSNKVLIVEVAATTKNPLADNRELVYEYDEEDGCPSDPTANSYYTAFYVYFVDSNKTLWRRTIKDAIPPGPNGGLCGGKTAWQRGSCSEARYTSGSYSSVCQTIDEQMASDVKTFSVQYFEDSYSTGPSALTSTTTKNMSTAAVAITLERSVAGKIVTVTNATKITSVNI